MNKIEAIKKYYHIYNEEFMGKEIVMGCGNLEARLLLVGEAPGRDEVKLLKPFVGKAGKQLDEFLEMLDIERDNLYITNAIKYRLFSVDIKTGRTSNRPASNREIESSRFCLLNEIDTICPEYIVTLGNVPLRAVTGDQKINIGSTHGKLSKVEVSGKEYSLFSLYHPASIIYNRSLRDVYISDILTLKDILTGKT